MRSPKNNVPGPAPVASAPRRRWLIGCGALLGVGAAVTAAALVAGGVWYKTAIVDDHSPELERSAILSVISEESPVYFRDGKTRVGVFFTDEHRQYVPWEALPPAYVASLVAAEDGRFWEHAGVDPWGIARAMWVNLQAGSVVAGGSTLTQQTAKNIFYRTDRSLRSKLAELQNALRLEHRHSKEQIFEFYVNQFHVSGNGRGIGIAARHFFDKAPSELTLAESAFLAGLV